MQFLQSAAEILRENAEAVLAVAAALGVAMLALAAFWLGACRRRWELARLAEENRALEKSLAQAQADSAAAHRQLAVREADIRRLAGELNALGGSEAELKARLEQAQLRQEQLCQEHAALAEHHRTLSEAKGRLEGQVHALEEERERLRAELDSKVGEIHALQRECDSLRSARNRAAEAKRRVKARLAKAWEHWQSSYEQCLSLQEEKKELTRQLEAVERQLEAVEKADGKIWAKPPTSAPPPFVPADQRRARILAFSNLKGGVGKTTLAANLGAMLARMRRCGDGRSDEKCKVLLVDLDHQASLTSLCLLPREIEQLRVEKEKKGGKGGFVEGLLWQAAENETASLRVEDYSRQHSEVPGLWIMPADETLAEVENRVMARWLVKPAEGDLRFLLRRVFHAPEVAQNYDFVILDCPPRLTAACVNAYAAADYVVVPVIPDPTSAEAVPRQLRTLLNHQDHLCADVKLLGLVANRTSAYGKPMVAREREVWESLSTPCRDVWGGEVYLFHTIIRQKPAFHEAARDSRLAVSNPEIEAMFRDLAQEVLQRIEIHEGRSSVPIA